MVKVVVVREVLDCGVSVDVRYDQDDNTYSFKVTLADGKSFIVASNATDNDLFRAFVCSEKEKLRERADIDGGIINIIERMGDLPECPPEFIDQLCNTLAKPVTEHLLLKLHPEMHVDVFGFISDMRTDQAFRVKTFQAGSYDLDKIYEIVPLNSIVTHEVTTGRLCGFLKCFGGDKSEEITTEREFTTLVRNGGAQPLERIVEETGPSILIAI